MVNLLSGFGDWTCLVAFRRVSFYPFRSEGNDNTVWSCSQTLSGCSSLQRRYLKSLLQVVNHKALSGCIVSFAVRQARGIVPVSLIGTERIAYLDLLRTVKPPGHWFSLSPIPAWPYMWILRGHEVVWGKSGASRIFLHAGSFLCLPVSVLCRRRSWRWMQRMGLRSSCGSPVC